MNKPFLDRVETIALFISLIGGVLLIIFHWQ